MKSFLASFGLMLCAALASAADFDWKTRFPEGLIDANGKAVDLATLKNKTVAVYCSAHWCPPCRVFTPQRQVRQREQNQASRGLHQQRQGSGRDVRVHEGNQNALARRPV